MALQSRVVCGQINSPRVYTGSSMELIAMVINSKL